MGFTDGYVDLFPADVVFTEVTGGFVSKAILWATRAPGEEKSKCGHVAMVFDPADPVGHSVLVEQTSPKQQLNTLDKYLKAGRKVYVYRNVNLNWYKRREMADRAVEDNGKTYGYGKIALFFADALVGKTTGWIKRGVGKLFGKDWKGSEPKIFSNINLTGAVVCSQTIARYYSELNIEFGGAWQTMSPDDMMDWCETDPNWELVYEG